MVDGPGEYENVKGWMKRAILSIATFRSFGVVGAHTFPRNQTAVVPTNDTLDTYCGHHGNQASTANCDALHKFVPAKACNDSTKIQHHTHQTLKKNPVDDETYYLTIPSHDGCCHYFGTWSHV